MSGDMYENKVNKTCTIEKSSKYFKQFSNQLLCILKNIPTPSIALILIAVLMLVSGNEE
jgi:hypothetical protein